MQPGPRERLITSATALVRQYGVAGTGIAELVKHSKTARRSIYMHFPRGKAELIAESTRVAGQSMAARIANLDTRASPAQALAAFADAWNQVLRDSDFTCGCPIVAAALSRSEAPEAADAAGAVFTQWEQALAAHLHRAGIAEATAVSLATTTVAAIEGAVVLALAARSAQPLERTTKHLGDLIAQHLPRAP